MNRFPRVHSILPAALLAGQAACAVEATSSESELPTSGIAQRVDTSYAQLSSDGVDLQVTWFFDGLFGQGVEPCDHLEATTAEVVVQPSRGPAFAENFYCTAGTGRIRDLPLDTYSVHVNLVDRQGGAVGQSTYSETVQATVPHQVISVPAFDLHGGQFELTWSVRSRQGQVGCEAVGGAGVSVLSTPVSGSSTGYDDVFHDCNAGYGRTTELPFADYTVVVSLLDRQELAIATAPAQQAQLTTPASREIVNLGDFDFAL
jgi:hypothetical protein